jgi:superfamily I DNA/RNA helicase
VETIGKLCESAEKGAPYLVLKALLPEISLTKAVQDDEEGDNSPINNVEQIMAFASNYDTCAAAVDAVDRILKHKRSTARSKNVVEVSTIHRYKGREAPVIYMPGLVNGLFPSSRADLLEERRLFYVGVTRAMDELWMSFRTFAHDDTPASPSMFLDEAQVKVSDAYEPGRKIQPVRVETQMGLLI